MRKILLAIVALSALGQSAQAAQVVFGREDDGSTLTGRITNSDCCRTYTFQASPNQIVVADIDHDIWPSTNGQNVCLEVYDPSGTAICRSNEDFETRDPSVGCVIRVAGTHTVKINGNGSCSGCLGCCSCVSTPYDFQLHVTVRNKASDGSIVNAIQASRNILP